MNCILVKDRKCEHESVAKALPFGEPVVDERAGLRMVATLLICTNCLLGRLSHKREAEEA